MQNASKLFSRILLLGRKSPTRGRIALPGLDAEVEVIRDAWGIPHIRAQGTKDLFFAQGFVHAQDRLWQMEVIRRLTWAGSRKSRVRRPFRWIGTAGCWACRT